MRYLTILLMLLSVGAVHAQNNPEITATVYQTVNVRSGPGTQYEIIGQLSEGDTVPVLARDSAATRWLNVALPAGDVTGWVAVFTVTLDGDPQDLEIATDAAENADNSPDNVTVTAFGRVNIRQGPGITYDIIAQLRVDDIATATARNNYNNDWLYIVNDDIEGWVAYFTVTVTGNADTLPVLVPDHLTGTLVPPTTLVRANFNVRLHSRASFSAPVTGIVPFAADITPVGVSQNGRWLYVAYDDIEGWGWARLFDITDEQLAMIPRRAAG